MLIRLIFGLFLCGAGVFAYRLWRLRMEQRARIISGRELLQLTEMATHCDPMRDALKIRKKVQELCVLPEAMPVREQVDAAIRELAIKVGLCERLLKTADELEESAPEREIRISRREAEVTEDAEARRHIEERVAVLERQRASAIELRRRRDELQRAIERIVLALRDVHVASLELEASSGATKDGVGGIRVRLQDATEELRRRASAHDEVAALLEASTPRILE